VANSFVLSLIMIEPHIKLNYIHGSN